MTTFLYTTTSNTVGIKGTTRVASLLDRYEFTVTPTFDQDNRTLSFTAVDSHSSFDVFHDRSGDPSTRGFLEELAPFLTETLTIKCVETQGHGEATAFKWVVEPDGSVTLHQF